ncbi:MAG: hypothetical protein JWR37_1071, partial [Mycobacterium sp.]|nr:hypothetical protein [Mycobacterium sp.]
MAEFVVNVILIGALLLLLVIWAVSAGRRRRRSRREHAEERRLILSAFTGAATTSTAPSTVEDDGLVTSPLRGSRAANTSPAAPAQLLDAASVAALLDLLEDRRPVRRGRVAGLFTSPRSVWSAGTRAGQHIGRYTMVEQDGPAAPAGSELYRDAAAELIDIHAHNPADACGEYSRYAAALADSALAELYVRRAAYATYADHDQVIHVVAAITG